MFVSIQGKFFSAPGSINDTLSIWEQENVFPVNWHFLIETRMFFHSCRTDIVHSCRRSNTEHDRDTTNLHKTFTHCVHSTDLKLHTHKALSVSCHGAIVRWCYMYHNTMTSPVGHRTLDVLGSSTQSLNCSKSLSESVSGSEISASGNNSS